MKNKMTISEKCGDRLRVVRCFNLAPVSAAEADVLRPVGAPLCVAPAGWMPLTEVNLASGSRLIVVYSGATLGVVSDDDATKVSVLAELKTVPRCAAVVDRRVVVMTDETPVTLFIDDDALTFGGEMPEFPAVTFSAVAAGSLEAKPAPLSADVTSMTLTVKNSLFTAMADVVNALKADARRAGTAIQPILAGCRFVSATGEVVHRTPPVLVSLGANELGDFVKLYSVGADATLTPLTVSVNSFKVRVDFSGSLGEPWTRLVDRCEIVVASPFEVNTESSDRFEAFYRTANGERTVLASLGDMTALSSTTPDASRRAMENAVAAFETTAVRVATLRAPFDENLSRTLDFAVEPTALSFIEVDDTEPMRYVREPHTFTARECAVTGGSVVWADVTAHRFGGYDPRCYASELKDVAWRGVVAVTFASGDETVVWQGGGTTNAPASLGALLTYPAADAVSMTVRIKLAGESQRVTTVALRPDSSRRYAISFDTSAKEHPMTETTEPLVADAEAKVVRRFDHSVVVARSAAPTESVSTFSTDGAITAVTAAQSSGGAWEFGRQRYHLFTDRGVALATVNSTLTTTSVNLIDRRLAVNGDAVCATTDATYFATPEGEIVRLTATRARTIVSDAFDVIALGHSVERGEIIAYIPNQNAARHYLIDSDFDRYTTRLAVSSPVWCNSTATTFVSDAGRGVLDLSRRDTEADVEIEWGATVPAGTARSDKRYVGAEFNIDSPSIDGRFEIRRSYIDRGSLVAMKKTRGAVAVSSPVRLVAVTRPMRSLAVALTATASPATRLASPAVISPDFVESRKRAKFVD
jgi:hypothetical protein